MDRKAKILIVDDKYDKVKLIVNLLNNSNVGDFKHVTNSRDALKEVKDTTFDLMVIDLQIPENLGSDIDPNGGEKLLNYIDINDNIKKPTHILGITEHMESFDSCLATFNKMGWSLICGIEDEEKIKSIIEAKIKHAVTPPTWYDVAIVTALDHTELEAVLRLPFNWIPVKDRMDCNIYYSGSVDTSSGSKITVIATSCIHMGIAQSSAVGMKICLKYKPKFIFMTGIAAGIKGKVNIGDVLFADPCWDWGNGKQTIVDGKPKFISAPRQIALVPSVRAKIKNLTTTRKYLDEIYNSWPASKPAHTLNAHIGPLATGAVVLEDPSVVDMIKSQHRETIGVEMEAYGIMLAASISSTNPPTAIILKSVCDFADPNKGNEWQSYAAYTSASLAMKIIVNEIFSD